jgi:hypothetical protein
MFFISKDEFQLDSTLGFFFIIFDISSIASRASLKENQDSSVTFTREGNNSSNNNNKQKRPQQKSVRHACEILTWQDLDVLSDV